MIEEQDQLKEVTIFTDGGCDPNPGPGGYGVILIYGNTHKALSGGFRLTTNNRMEIFAAIAGLEALKFPCKVRLYSDSKYLVDGMAKGWVQKWQDNGWWRNKKTKATNIDLWEKLLALCNKHQVEFEWVKGHAGLGANERCDKISIAALKQPDLPTDEGYEQREDSSASKIVYEGQPCRKCSTPVVKKVPRHKQKQGQTYYYEYYFYCPNCSTMYMVEEAKRHFESQTLF